MNRACLTKNANLHEQKQHASYIRPLKYNFIRMKTKFLFMVFAFIISGTIVFSQDTTKTDGTKKLKAEAEMQKDSVYYTCPMHTDVKMDKTGKCHKCGMDLEMHKMKSTGTDRNKSEAMKSYTCPMHSEVVSDKSGKCPECGMGLVPKK
jgi:hypothetical protein